MDKPVIIIGANTIGKSAMEAFLSNEIVVYGFLDDSEDLIGNEIGDVTVLGTMDDDAYTGIIGKESEAFVATEEIELRKNLVDELVTKHKTMPINAIHGGAQISASAEIGHGNYIAPAVILGSRTKIGSHTILNTGAIINDEATLGDFSQVGAGAIINAGVTIAEEVFIGSGVIIVAGVKVGKGARIGAGSVVINEVKEGETVFGNPATAV